MHVPSSATSEITILPFRKALEEASREKPEYDVNQWLYVPDFYTEYRYILGTRGKKPLICVGINPSTAQPGRLDNTLKSVERIALGNGYDSFIMFNVYAQRATDPDTMEKLMRRLRRQKEFALETEDYKRPRAPAPSKLLEPWYRARSFTICHSDKLTDELFSRDIVDHLKQGFTFLLPYYDYFVTLDGDPDPRDADG